MPITYRIQNYYRVHVLQEVKCGNKRVACDIGNRLILPASEAQNYLIEKFSCLPKNGYAAVRCSIHFGITLAVMCGASETLTGISVEKSPSRAPAQTSLPKQKILAGVIEKRQGDDSHLLARPVIIS